MINRLRNYLNDNDSRVGHIRCVVLGSSSYKLIQTDRDYCRATGTFCGVPISLNKALSNNDVEVY